MNTMDSCIIRIVFLIVVLFHQNRLSGACDNGFTRFEDSCYRVSHDTESWIGSEYTCRLENGNLAQINSARENGFLQQLLKTHGADNAWMGATDIDIDGDWLWWPEKARVSYSHWAPGEPNNSGGTESCGMIGNNGLWNDATCHSNFRYICEKPYDSPEVIG